MDPYIPSESYNPEVYYWDPSWNQYREKYMVLSNKRRYNLRKGYEDGTIKKPKDKNEIRRKFLEDYKKACSVAAKIRREEPPHWMVIDIESLPKKFHAHHKKLIKAKQILRQKGRIINLDKNLRINKYYPWCYKGYDPVLYPQGFYSKEYAKKFYLTTYGPEALKFIKFIKGKTALERGFNLSESLYINGRWRRPAKRYLNPPEIPNRSYKRNLKKAIKPSNSPREEKQLVKEMEIMTYGRGHIHKIDVSERSKLQEKKDLNRKRRKTLYEK